MSNLLDKASIILTPTAYNNGEALCVKPSDGSGDFDFSRNSAATRVNAQGLVENVQILSSNLVQNGDFSEEGSEEVSNGSFSQEGVQLVTNGDFSSDTNWVKQAGWSISGGTANCDGSQNLPESVYQNGVTVVGKTYKITYTLVSITSGTVRAIAGTLGGAFQSTIGTHTEYLTATSNTAIQIQGSSSFIGSIDNVSVREVAQNWELQNGWSIGNDVAVFSGTASAYRKLYQESILTIGETYKLTFDIVSINSGSIKNFSQSNPTSYSTIGTKTEYFTATFDDLFLEPTTDADCSITNISVKEVGQNWDLTGTWSIENNLATANANSTSQYLQQNFNITNGKKYLFSYEIIENTLNGNGASLSSSGGFGSVSLSNVIGTHEVYIDATNAAAAYALKIGISGTASSGILTISNISVIEITDDTNLPRINYEGFSYQDALGSEEIVNGGFDSDTAWSKGSGWAIANGVATHTGGASYLSQSILNPNTQYKVKIKVSQASGSNFVQIYMGGSPASVLIQNVGEYEYIFTSQPSIGLGFALRGAGNVTIDNVSVKEYLGQEVVPDSGCGSWLFEPQSTNLITYSEDFSNAAWQKFRVSITPNTLIAPNGELAANSLIEDTTNNTHVLRYAITPNSNSYTFSVFVKSLSGNRKLVMNSSDVNSFAVFDIENGVIESEQNIDASSIEDYGNGWYRCSVTKDNNTSENFDIRLNNGSTNTYIGDGTSGVYIWGAMLEENSYPTSIIPTEGSTVTRNQDVCTNGGSLASINSTSGTLYAQIAALVEVDNARRFITLNDGTASNGVVLRYEASGIIVARYQIGGVAQCSIAFATTITDTHKIAFKYSLNDFALWVDGVEVGVDNSGNVLAANTINNIDFNSGNGTFPFFGKTKALAVWKEALSDQKLAELTTI